MSTKRSIDVNLARQIENRPGIVTIAMAALITTSYVDRVYIPG